MRELRSIREGKGYTQVGLAEALGVGRTSVTMWEAGKSDPPVKLLPRLADLLGVTTDALLGRERQDAPPCSRGSDHPPDNLRAVFATNLKRYAAGKGVKQKDIAFALGIPQTTVSDWFTGKKYPRIEAMEQLADYLGVRFSALVCGDAPEQLPEHRGTHTPNDQDHLRGEDPMVTLNDLLQLTEMDYIQLLVQITPNLTATIAFQPDDSDSLADAEALYGHYPVVGLDTLQTGTLVITLARPGANS